MFFFILIVLVLNLVGIPTVGASFYCENFYLLVHEHVRRILLDLKFRFTAVDLVDLLEIIIKNSMVVYTYLEHLIMHLISGYRGTGTGTTIM